MWPLEHTQAKKLTTDAWHSIITITHSEHFVLRWAKNKKVGEKKLKLYDRVENNRGEKENILVASIFPFSINVFKSFLKILRSHANRLKICQNQSICRWHDIMSLKW